jgi:hypothetical protein
VVNSEISFHNNTKIIDQDLHMYMSLLLTARVFLAVVHHINKELE